jgi:hypothetical protein
MKYATFVILNALTALVGAFRQAAAPMRFPVKAGSSSHEFEFRPSPVASLCPHRESHEDFGYPRLRNSQTLLISRRTAYNASFDTLGRVISSKLEILWDSLKDKVPTQSRLLAPISKTLHASVKLFQKSWWMLPMLLALIPPYLLFAKGMLARMPDGWQVVRMEHLVSAGTSSAVVGFFLFSNIAFFLVGGYLLYQFPPTIQAMQNEDLAQEGFSSQRTSQRSFLTPTRYTLLSAWMLASGLISTVFHSVQAFGSYPISESLCFIDHGVAFSSFFYFFEVCGRPSGQVVGLGALAGLCLCLTSPGYVWFHSAWHIFIAMAAGLWAKQGCKEHMRVSSSAIVNPVFKSPSLSSSITEGRIKEKRRIPVSGIASFVIYTVVHARLQHSKHSFPPLCARKH